jgi:HAD superfamily hydrolase (TIGR01484 family)
MNTAWLFDVDATLTNHISRKIDQIRILDEIIKRLNCGDIIGINTGRSLSFIENEILDPLEKKISNHNLLDNIIALGEKGAAVISYNNGVMKNDLDESTCIPNALKAEVLKIVSRLPYSKAMRNDETKQTLTTIEMKPGENHEEFKKLQQNFVKDLKKLLEKTHLENKFDIDVFRIATDLQSKNVGKTFATNKFVKLLNSRGLNPDKYICFGDDTNDYQMYEELKRLAKNVKLVFVGEKEKLEGKDLKDVVFTRKNLDEGTLEYLQRS